MRQVLTFEMPAKRVIALNEPMRRNGRRSAETWRSSAELMGWVKEGT